MSDVAACCAMFQHWNVKTPRWLGCLIQRPLRDMLMGRFANRETFDGDVGFAGDGPRRRGAMLLFQDVNTPRVSTAGRAGA